MLRIEIRRMFQLSALLKDSEKQRRSGCGQRSQSDPAWCVSELATPPENGDLGCYEIVCLLPTPRLQEIFKAYYLEGATFREMGQQLNLSEARISQLHSQGIVFLRDKLKDEKYTYIEDFAQWPNREKSPPSA